MAACYGGKQWLFQAQCAGSCLRNSASASFPAAVRSNAIRSERDSSGSREWAGRMPWNGRAECLEPIPQATLRMPENSLGSQSNAHAHWAAYACRQSDSMQTSSQGPELHRPILLRCTLACATYYNQLCTRPARSQRASPVLHLVRALPQLHLHRPLAPVRRRK